MAAPAVAVVTGRHGAPGAARLPAGRSRLVEFADDGPPVVPSRTPTGGDVRRGLRAEIAQLVEHATENRGVGSSSLPLGTITPGAVIERKWLSW